MNFRQKRKEMGLTQADMAFRIGCSRQYYNELEKHPNSRRLSAELLKRIANAFGVSMDEVVA